MPTIKVAHIREQGTDLIIAPLDNSFGYKSEEDQRAEIDELQFHSTAAGMRGTVVPVWDAGGGRMRFIAPQNWHPFFKSISLVWILGNVNREIHWN